MYLCEDGVENLSRAIITQACKDYVSAKTLLLNNGHSIAVDGALYDCNRFFRSDWYELLTDLDAKSILKGLDNMVKNNILSNLNVTIYSLYALHEEYGTEINISGGHIAR